MKTILTFLLLISFSITHAQPAKKQIHFEVDKLAKYNGGYSEFSKYVSENIFCKAKINRKKKYELQLRFIVEINGQIKKVELNSLTPFLCKEEIIRVVKNSQNWKPAMKDNLPVRSIVQIPIILEQ